MGAGDAVRPVYRLPDVVSLVAATTVLSTVSVGVARSELDVPEVVCWTFLVPVVATTSAAGVLPHVGFGVDGSQPAAGVRVAILSLGGFYVPADAARPEHVGDSFVCERPGGSGGQDT